MTEEEWLSCTDPKRLVEYLEFSGRLSERKRRLLACACCRRVWHLLSRPALREAVETAERLADRLTTREELQQSWKAVRKALANVPLGTNWEHAWAAVLQASSLAGVNLQAVFVSAAEAAALDAGVRRWTPKGAVAPEWEPGCGRERAAQCELVRDLFPPFQEVAAEPSWRTRDGGVARRVAQAIYEGRRFEELPILADALEEACCTEAGLLGHLRGPGPHARGCWAVDLLLERD